MKKKLNPPHKHGARENRKFVKVNELSKLIGFSKSWIRAMTTKKLIPCYKINCRNILYSLAEVEEFIKSYRVETVTEASAKMLTLKKLKKKGANY